MSGPGRTRQRVFRARWAAVGGALLCAAQTVVPHVALAQLAVDHVEVTLDPRPGGEHVALITVRNQGAKTVQAVLRLEDWDRAEDGNNRWYPLGTLPRSCGKILQLFPLSVNLAAGASQTMRVTLDSAAAVHRECWAGAVVETASPQVVSGRSVMYLLRTAVKIYVHPSGLAAGGSVADMQIHPAHAPGAADSVARVEVVFENTGERHLLAHGSVEFRRADNSLAASLKIPDLYVLPGARRRVALPLPVLSPGRYVALSMVDYGGDEIAAAQIDYEVH